MKIAADADIPVLTLGNSDMMQTPWFGHGGADAYAMQDGDERGFDEIAFGRVRTASHAEAKKLAGNEHVIPL